MAKAKSSGTRKVVGRQIKWVRDPTVKRQWLDELYGFALWEDKDFIRPAFVSWDEGLAAWMMRNAPKSEEQFSSLDEAKAWCQAQIDGWVAAHTVLLD